MGALYLLGYILIIGVATFLMKYAMKDLDAYQINLLMAFGMLVITLPLMWIVHKSFSIPRSGLALGSFIGLMMGAGSLLYVLALSKLPAGLTAVIATSYVIIVILLSWLVLKESMTLLKVFGIFLTVAGVMILSYRS